MTKRSTTAGVVIILLHLLQRCSANATTMLKNDETTSTSGTITPSTSEQTTIVDDTTLTVSERSYGYVQNGSPQESTTTTVSASVDRSEQVANASPATQYPTTTGDTSPYPPLQMIENATTSEQSTSTGTISQTTLYPTQNDTSSFNKSSGALVSSSKVNTTDSGDEIEASDVDTDNRSSLAEKDVSNTNETETQSTLKGDDKIKNETATSSPGDLTRSGIRIGEADVRDDDEDDDFGNFYETSNAPEEDDDMKKNETSIQTYSDDTKNLNTNEMEGVEVALLADDLVDPDVPDESNPVSSNDAVTKLPDVSIPNSSNETTQTPNTNSVSGSPDGYNATDSHASNTNGAKENTPASESVANPLQDLKLHNFKALINAFGNENNQYSNSNGTGNPSNNQTVSNMTSEYESGSNGFQLFSGFEEVQVLADDISLDDPEGQSVNDGETNDNGSSDTQSLSSDSEGTISECNNSQCQNSNNQPTLDKTADGYNTTGLFPQDTSNDQENIANIENTSVGMPSGNDSQSLKANEDNSPNLNATDTLVETPINDSSNTNKDIGNSPDQTLRQQETEVKMDNESPVEDEASDSQVPEVSEDMSIPSNDTTNPQKSTSQVNYSQSFQKIQGEMVKVKEIIANGQMLNETVPMGGVLTIYFEKDEKQDAASESKAPEMPQEHASPEHKEGDEKVEEGSNQAYPSEEIEVLADDIGFEEDDKGTDGYSRPMEENLEDSYTTTTTFKPYFITESYEPKSSSPKCPFSVKASDTQVPKEEQNRTAQHIPEGQIVEDPYYYEPDPFCLTRHHVLIPAVPLILPQWCFVPDTPDFMCPRYDLGFHIAFAHETHRDMYYRCVYGQAVLLKCPNLHYWDDERKICMLMSDFTHYQRHPYHPSRNLYDHATHHHCQHCRRNFLLPQDLDPTAQCSDRVLLACNTDGTLSVYECPGFYYYDRQIQLRWYADLERCDYPADGDGPWH
uniref:Chitin-binding type-2 domain-containing protein n=1 Tax=Anopheles culicifacies TaxID=139723 RepID=A0A182MAB0_9DIPT